MKFLPHGFRFILTIFSFFFVTVIHCVNLEDYIHINYIKKKYPEINTHALKAQAICDDQTAPATVSINTSWVLQFLSVAGVIGFLLKNSNKIGGWLHAISPKYPLDITLGNATQNGGHSVNFGVPYYFFIPYTALIYFIVKR